MNATPTAMRPAATASSTAVETHDLRKSFDVAGKPVDAVRGVDLEVRAGEVFGFLGPNGAGKTTTLRMLTTLLAIDSGHALVAGLDVARDPAAVRRRIGYVSQLGGADRPATGRENLLLQAELYGMSKAAGSARADELTEVFELGAFIDRRVLTYSGGQRRRLEVALGIIHRPEILFLDEPTTGLDPQNRANLWEQLRELRTGGTTIFLTTHYLEEADALSDRLVIIDSGRVVAEGTPRELKQQIAGETVVLKPKAGAGSPDALLGELAREPYVRDARVDGESLRLAVSDGTESLPEIFELLRTRGVPLETVSLSEPSLDDVFLRKTGRSLRDAGEAVVA
ncbi:MAG TPA: ATP-binding cassette domain-containing protein [Solirubrobacteraceae bacterium]|nr:ATP-binding cassette domain-containing protein [Solirubrobacteraceae bacterium]